MDEKEILHTTEKVYEPREHPTDKNDRWKSTLAQFYVTFVLSIFLLSVGSFNILSTILMGALHNKKDDPMSMDDAAASLYNSLYYVSYLPATLATGFLSERFGRRGTLVPGNLLYIGSWVLLYYSRSVLWLHMSMVLSGFGMGLSESTVSAYLGEISEPHLRGTLSTLSVVALTLGALLELGLDFIFNWRTITLFSFFVSVVSFLLLKSIPESPVWLITKDRLTDAQKALGMLRGWKKPQDVQKEFEEMVRYTKLSNALPDSVPENQEEEVTLENKNKPAEETTDSWFKARYKEVTNPKIYLPLRFILITFWFTGCAILIPFKNYLIEIMQNFWFPVDQQWILMMMGTSNFIGSFLPVFIIRHYGKRKLTIVSMILGTICTFIFGLFASFFTHTKDLLLSWLLIFNYVAHTMFMCLGPANTPWMLLCEVFPVRARGFATGLSVGWGCFSAFIQTLTYLYMQSLVGLSGMYYLYGSMSLLGCVYFYLYMPETEGKTLEKIETYFTPNHDRKEKFRMPPRDLATDQPLASPLL